jgi:uncharacterized OsmC-like protein
MKKSKKIILAIVIIIGVIVAAGGIYWFSMPVEQRNMVLFMVGNGDSYDNYQEYQVIDRNDKQLAPTAFEPSADTVIAITGMVKNENSKMMKKAMVEDTSIADYTGWQVIADEGAAEGENPFGPSPLSYYTSGLAANLHTQILKAAEVKGVELDNVKVEVLNTFRWDDMMAANGAGFLDVSTTNIIIESSASIEVIQEIKEMALKSWTAGEALRNETVIKPTLVVNKNNFQNYHATPGTTLSENSVVDGLALSSITAVPKKPQYLELADKDEEQGMQGFDSMANMQFEIFAISESAGTSERPYLNKITLSTPSGETWEIYADEFMGPTDHPVAPTSLEYFTVGTALCLTSQTTLVSAMMGLDFTDYRVESQADFEQGVINSYVIIESDESQERLETFYNKSLSLCFAGEGLKNATEMVTTTYLNGKKLN